MYKARERRIEIISQRLLRKRLPRIQVSLILSLTALAGFLTSFTLLQFGVKAMWLRYPVATLVAYCVFLLLLGLWLRLQRHGADSDPLSDPVLDPGVDFIPLGSHDHAGSVQFGGGDAGGAGAGGSWGESVPSSSPISSPDSASPDVGFDLDLEGAWLIVIAIVALVGGVIATFYIIYIAPALLAEILIDGALVAGLYRRVKHIEQRHWLRAAVRRTVLPAILVALVLTVAGYALQKAVPEAHTMGEVLTHLLGRK